MANLTEVRDGKTYLVLSDNNPTSLEIVEATDYWGAPTHQPPTEDDICRTCTKAKNRFWREPESERVRLAMANEMERACHPDQFNVSVKLTRDGERFIDWEARPSKSPVSAIVYSCGWTQRPDCARCTWFRSYTVSNAHTSSTNGPERYRSTAAIGYCAQPDHQCTPTARKSRALDPMCLNCEYCMTFSTNFMLDEYDRTVAKIDLDRFEKLEARRYADRVSGGENGKHPGVAYNEFVHTYTTNYGALWTFWAGTLIAVKDHNGVIFDANEAVDTAVEELSEIQVQFSSGRQFWFPVGMGLSDATEAYPRWGKAANQHKGIVKIFGRQFLDYGLKHSPMRPNIHWGALRSSDSPTRRTMDVENWTCRHGLTHARLCNEGEFSTPDMHYDFNCSICVRSASYFRPKTEHFADRVDIFCHYCKPNHACSAHARGLRSRGVAAGWAYEFTDPDAENALYEAQRGAERVIYVNGELRTPDGGTPTRQAIVQSVPHIIRALNESYARKMRAIRLPIEGVVARAKVEADELRDYLRELQADRAMRDDDDPMAASLDRAIARVQRKYDRAMAFPRAQQVAIARRMALTQAHEADIAYLINTRTEIVRSLPLKRRRSIDYEPGFGAPMPVEAFKHYCALALPRVMYSTRTNEDGTKTPVTMHIPQGHRGIDFRAAMGDSFGIMRGAEWDVRSSDIGPKGNRRFASMGSMYTRQTETWSERMAQEERIRGTNPLERYQEELLINDAIVYQHGTRGQTPEPVAWRVTRLDMGVSEVENDEGEVERLTWSPLGSPVDSWATPYDPVADRAMYLEYLDEPTEIVMHSAEVDVDSDISRDDVVAAWTNRYRIHGYENFRRASQRSKGEEAQAFGFNHYRQTTDELVAEIIQGFKCNVCDMVYSPDELETDTCPTCDVPLIDVYSRDEWQVSVSLSKLPDIPKGRRMGIGYAVAADSPRYQTETRLTRMCCDYWMLKGSAARGRPTTLRDL